MSSASGPAVQLAAGALVWRVRQGRLQVILVHRPRYKDWSWPKGKLEPGETLVAAATREVAEETGYDVVLGQPLPRLQYPISDGRLKQVHYWAAQVAGRPDATALIARSAVPRASREEIDDVRWFDADVAAHKVTRPADAEPLTALVAAYEKGRLDTRALVVVRHGRARGRSSWPGTEGTRPLTPAGRVQAQALVPLLSGFGVVSIITSPWERCLATVASYAQASGTVPQTRDELTEDAHSDAPAHVAAEVDALLAGRTDVALCTHRPVLPTVLDVIARHARRRVADALPTSDPYLRPGEMLVAHVALTATGPRVVAAERHAPSRV